MIARAAFGSMPKDDPNVGTGLVGAPECGDVMMMQMKIDPETRVIEEGKFKVINNVEVQKQKRSQHGADNARSQVGYQDVAAVPLLPLEIFLDQPFKKYDQAPNVRYRAKNRREVAGNKRNNQQS